MLPGLAAEPPYTRSVRTVVWEGRLAMAVPIPMCDILIFSLIGFFTERFNIVKSFIFGLFCFIQVTP